MYGDEYLKRNLQDPPRQIPLLLAIQLLFSGVLCTLGWVFLGFGMIFVWIFAANTDPFAFFVFHGHLETARGVVTSVEETDFSEGGSEHTPGTPIYRLCYRFSYQGHDFEGASYRLRAPRKSIHDVTIEFPAGRPNRSRIRGMRSAVFGPFALIAAIFPAIGLLFVVFTLRRGFKRIQFLKHGELASGELVAKEPTNTQINNQTVYKMTFAFQTALGKKAEITVRTHETERLEDDQLELLLYDPVKPTRGTTLDNLPGSPRIEKDGTISIRNASGAYVALIIPTLTVLGHGTYVMMRFVLH